MSSFKVKNRKKVQSDIRVTLDAKHSDRTKYFEELQESLPEKKNVLIKLQKNIMI